MFNELDTYDWQEAFGIADMRRAHPTSDVPLGPLDREDVVEIVASEEGYNDGPPWQMLGRVRDGRWFFLSAGCDYTGWDCQAGGTITVATTRTELLEYGMTAEERRDLRV